MKQVQFIEGDVHQVDYDYAEIPEINIEDVENLEGDEGEVLTCVLNNCNSSKATDDFTTTCHLLDILQPLIKSL